MSDDLHNRGPADRARINLHESWELRWCHQLGVTPEQLKEIVHRVGPMAVDVRKHLGKKVMGAMNRLHALSGARHRT